MRTLRNKFLLGNHEKNSIFESPVGPWGDLGPAALLALCGADQPFPMAGTLARPQVCSYSCGQGLIAEVKVCGQGALLSARGSDASDLYMFTCRSWTTSVTCL